MPARKKTPAKTARKPLPKRLGPPTDSEEAAAAAPHGLPVQEMSKDPTYTWEQKAQACMSYCVTGNGAKAGRLCGIDQKVISRWKIEAPWWPEAVAVCRKQLQDKFDSKITGILDGLLTNIADKVENGEQIFNHKDGEMVARDIPAKDQAMIFGILHDKRALMRGDATSIRQGGTDEMLRKLEDRMAEFARALKHDKVVSDQ